MEQLIQERIAPLDGLAASRAAALAAERKARGRPVDLRDTLIAGIALHGVLASLPVTPAISATPPSA
ncbi:hypothetical protein VB716_15095 [Synechococcus sp. CCY9201]|nr:hypothetical protein [Synechococcus sp. CCY9201]